MYLVTGHLKTMLLIFALIFFLGFTSCMKEEKPKSKSMEEIQAEEGLPVTIINIKKSSFENTITFYAKLSGIMESQQATNFAERVKNVNAKLGDFVKQGEVIVEFSTDIPTLQFNQAKIGYESAERLFYRTRELLKAGETSLQNLENAQSNYEMSKRNFEAMNQMIKVDAPFSGTIVKMDVKEGEIPVASNPGMPRPLFTVAKLDVIKATIQATEEEVTLLKVGMPATINYLGEIFTGRIAEISPVLDTKTQSFNVEAHFQNGGRKLKSGVTTELNVKSYYNPEAITIPRNLMITEAKTNFVFVEKNGIAEKRPVVIGKQNGVKVEIAEGLQVGDKLINCCKTQLVDGIKVKVIK